MKKMLDKVIEEQHIMARPDVQLSFSCSFIELEVEQGQKVQGSFRITTDERYKPEGYVYCNDLHMTIKTPTFCGLDMEVSFWFDSTGIAGGYTKEDVFYIVSNLGEYEIPYRVSVTPSLPVGSLGEVKNLFHFANLAQSDWDGALDIFYSRQFANILIGNDAQYRTLYRGLSKDPGNEENMDHFLEIAKKKVRSVFSTDVKDIHISDPQEDVIKNIKIVRDGWGYSSIQVRCEGDFIEGEELALSTRDFNNNTYEYDFTIFKSELHVGVNEAKIIISNFDNTIVVPIKVICSGLERRDRECDLCYRMKLMQLYMDYRLGKKHKNEWLKECNSLVGRRLQKDANDVESRLYQVQLLYAEKRVDDANKILDRVANMLGGASPEMMGYYFYLSSLGCKDEEFLRHLSDDAELLYVQNIHSWRLAWVTMHLKNDYIDNDRAKWDFIKKQYEAGSNSPVMFIEALEAMLQTPVVMSEIGEFEIAFMTFVTRQGALARDIRNRFVFLCAKLTAFSQEIYELLVKCYEAEAKNDTLTEICNQLMKGNKFGAEYFPWYAKAVDQELRINKLYEYYMMSIDLKFQGRLPKLVLMYFAYRSNLDYERNAFLYANVIKHKQAYQDIYQDYIENIEAFASQQLFNGRINEDLSFIYNTILAEKLEDPEYASAYADIVFKTRINVNNDKAKKIIVLYDHLETEDEYNLFNGEAICDIVGDYNVILIEDEAGNRHYDEALYTAKAIVTDQKRVEEIVAQADLKPKQALYLAETSGERVVLTKNNENALLMLAESEEVTKDYHIEVLLTLAEYYFEHDEISRLDDVISRFNPANLQGKDREICIRIFVARGMYDKAFEWVKDYGTEYIDYKILVRLCDRMLVRTDFEYDSDQVKICAGLFELGKYDETILNYLLMYQQCTSKELKKLWRGADSFDLDVSRLLENIIVQLMYSNEKIGEENNIFLEYISKSPLLDVEKAYLNKLCYEYFINEKEIFGEVLDRLNYHHNMDEELSDYCYLAYLKYMADIFRKKNLGTEERVRVERYLKREMDRHMFFPFFMEFSRIVPSLDIYSDRLFVEYKGDEKSKAILHYVIEENGIMDENHQRAEMPHMLGGIFVMSFILFKGEKIHYYITEEGPRQEKLTKSSTLSMDGDGEYHKSHRFYMINNIVNSHVNGNKEAFLRNAEEYVKKSYMVDNLFTIEAE